MSVSGITGRTLVVLSAAAIGLTASAAMAQNASATIYRDTSFRGPAVAVESANPNLRLNFPVYSIRIARGDWELCSQPNFRGTCITVLQSTSDLRRAHNWAGPLQSMRPVTYSPPPGGGGGSGQQSLRGMASEYFPAPRQANRPNSARVQACPGGNATSACASQNADRFCRSVGWNGSAYERMETVNRRIYLADVLCVRSGY